jgi:hypothetical protein
LGAILKAARKDRTPMLVPATVVAETWRGSDVNDIIHLLQSAKISYALFGARASAAAQVTIIRV